MQYDHQDYINKHKKPDFDLKLGEWVRIEYTDKGFKTEVTQVTSELQKLHTSLAIKSIKLWKPKNKDWCWNAWLGLVQYDCTCSDGSHKIWDPHRKRTSNIHTLEPFIGTLPTYLGVRNGRKA